MEISILTEKCPLFSNDVGAICINIFNNICHEVYIDTNKYDITQPLRNVNQISQFYVFPLNSQTL